MTFSRPSTPLWDDSTAMPEFQPLATNTSCEVAIVGTGITGLTAGYYLAKEGKEVLILDDGALGGGQTKRTTAHITSFLDRRYEELVRIFGEAKATKIAASQIEAVSEIGYIVALERIDCDYSHVDAFLLLGQQDKTETLFQEMQAMQNIGFNNVVFGETSLWSHREIPYLMLNHQAQFDFLKYLYGLAARITELGGRIYSGTHVSGFEKGQPAKLTTANDREIIANNVIVATHSPITDLISIHTKQTAYRTYVIAGQVEQDVIPPGLYMDTEDPYHYIRSAQKGDKIYAIIGGEDHRTGQESDYDERYNKLEAWARMMLPQLGPIEYRWSGQIYEPVDGLPFIGRDPGQSENFYVATGYSGSGITNGTLAAKIICDQIVGRENIYSEIYDPSRKTAATLSEYLKENVNSVAQYSKYFSGGQVESAEEIPPGEGAIIARGVQHFAVYKDANGVVVECSAVCPHAKGIVCWNSAEKTWDCPAHGSRFDCTGEVIDGPANSDLEAKQMTGDQEDFRQMPLPLKNLDQTA